MEQPTRSTADHHASSPAQAPAPGVVTALRDERGFTFIELANVIMIVAVLSLMTLPAIGNTQDAARRSSCAERQRKIFEGSILYAVENYVGTINVNVNDLVGVYVAQGIAECPESESAEYDDYTIEFVTGEPMDVSCDIHAEHVWAPN